MDNSPIEKVRELDDNFKILKENLKIEQVKNEQRNLEKQISDPQIYSDHQKFNQLNQELTSINNQINQIKQISINISDLGALADLMNLENSSNDLAELCIDFNKLAEQTNKMIAKHNIITMLGFRYAQNDAILQIRTGTGGDDAADFSTMLLRMYQRWCEQNNYGCELLDYQSSELAGLKSASIKVSGKYAYGKLKFESGTHRLVRISPFNSLGKRQTSFSAVEVLPLLPPSETVQISDNDIKVDVFRSSGPGGQSVNTTDSAVRITHIASGIVVSVQNEKSQLQNKQLALTILQSRLQLLEDEKRQKELKDISSNITASWGDQIRNYVFHPYKLVKDLRTKTETSNVAKVLDGQIDQFIEAEISQLTKH